MKYDIFQSCPEGIDFLIHFEHEKKFSWDEFRDIAEAAFVYSLKKEEEERGQYHKSGDISYICEFMKSKGFTFLTEEVMQYELEYRWSLDKIHSLELRKMLEKE